MSRPAGEQIRIWFVRLVGLLILVDLAALTGSLMLLHSVGAVVERAQPLAAVTADMRHEIQGAQRDLFRYLAEVADDTAGVLEHLDRLSSLLAEARQIPRSETMEAELAAIEISAQRYRKVVELMPRTVAGSRNWSLIEDYSASAIQNGAAAEERAARLAETAQAEIRALSRNSARVARAALGVSAAVLVISLALVFRLRHWWVRFQDLMLGL